MIMPRCPFDDSSHWQMALSPVLGLKFEICALAKSWGDAHLS